MNDFKNYSGGNGGAGGGQPHVGANGNETNGGENKKPADVNNTVELAKILTRNERKERGADFTYDNCGSRARQARGNFDERRP